ncbi:uncharacterized protein AKAW2_80477A [Aspergillus luchuensis]|uniref:Uncharacterized protein n=1 Tax=Aspergillus kawachii TaxID=1069201 RepID=A0A7R8A3U9_ASPKA|nr:uncharacterized protein AKAW2_80477A [Aspergillus luchuensis]BCS04676.1 hypothetical protein AKAW2_80477A [Aspergillus luchuensis]BCS16247.1 hypothetical protein ALUC_80454A [Aspergillus luchuensis]
MTSPPESHRNFHPHGSRSEILLLPPRSEIMTSHPWTAMYLISPPLPRGVSAVQFNITSHDQGWCSDRSQGIWSWFDVSILCSERDGDVDDTSSFLSDLSDNPSSYLKPKPEDFRQVLQDQGLHFKDIPKEGNPDPDPARPGAIAKRVASNKIQRSWQQHVVFWRVEDGGEEAEFLSCLEEGDRLVVWARTQFPGWINCVKDVEIKVSVDEMALDTLPASGDGSETRQEDTVDGVL